MRHNLHRLFVDELREMLYTEEALIKALERWARAVEDRELKKLFLNHLGESRTQVTRIKQVFRHLKLQPRKKLCQAIRGHIRECNELLRDYRRSEFRDAALLAKVQRIEHFEMAAYGTLCAFARELELHKKLGASLHKTYDEEAKMDKMLTRLAKGNEFRPGLNRAANEWTAHHRMAAGW